jgi:hypothetical protein
VLSSSGALVVIAKNSGSGRIIIASRSFILFINYSIIYLLFIVYRQLYHQRYCRRPLLLDLVNFHHMCHQPCQSFFHLTSHLYRHLLIHQ